MCTKSNKTFSLYIHIYIILKDLNFDETVLSAYKYVYVDM